MKLISRRIESQRLCFSTSTTSTSYQLLQNQNTITLHSSSSLSELFGQKQQTLTRTVSLNQPTLLVNNHSQTQRSSLLSLLKSCTKKTRLLQIHARIIQTSVFEDPEISLKLLSKFALFPFQNMDYSMQIFSHIENPTLSHYNVMIKGYSLSAFPENGLHLFSQMRKSGVEIDPLSCTFVFKCCVRMRLVMGGVQVHGSVLRKGFRSDCLLMTTLMDFYSVYEKFDEAYKVFDEIPRRDTIAWNVLISCHLRSNRTRDALELFDAMMSGREDACEPDDVTCLHLLQAVGNLNALEFGERIHKYIMDQGYEDSVKVCNSLIVMYSRCGCMDKAFGVFKGMRNKNVVSWTALISGFAMNGYGKDAIRGFREMLKAGILPDEQTFTGVLSGCSHSGLVDEGLLIFKRMRTEYGVAPNIHHYGCMVDLLGRAGRLDQAYQLIMSMEVKPDSTIWRTLLGACKIHRHVDLGERVVENLIELKAQEAGDYVLLLNLYSSAGNWDKVQELRKFIKEKGIQTTPGCTTIELKGTVHEFTVDDITHPRHEEIYGMLDEIGKQLRIAGYVPEISSELHNLTLEEKGYRLSYHSEKLAIAFGVLATPPGTQIRIANNLRICVDCHTFAKFVSSVYNRMVVIRDRFRFHHFRGGRCSCNDYW